MVQIYKKFLSVDECLTLNSIALDGIKQGWVNKGIQKNNHEYEFRYTSRMHMQGVEYPQYVNDISKRIRSYLNIDNYPLILGHGKDGVVVSVTFQNGSVYEHKDARSKEGLGTFRCNVLTQKNEEGADLYVDGKKIEIDVGDLHCYWVSEFSHYVTEAKGETPRIMWMFGAHIPLSKMANINN